MEIQTGKDATGNPVVMKLYTAKSLTIGNKSFLDVSVLAINFDVMKDHVNPDVKMILGFNLIT